MNCPQCGHKNQDDFKFCEECGAALGLSCSHCGHLNKAEFRYCEECGSELGAQTAQEPKGPILTQASAETPTRTRKKRAPKAIRDEPSGAIEVDKRSERARRRIPGWAWLFIGLLATPLCLCSLLWFSVLPLTEGTSVWVRDVVRTSPFSRETTQTDSNQNSQPKGGIAELVDTVIEEIERRQRRNPPILGGDQTTALAPPLLSLCENWPFPWMPFFCPGEGEVAAAQPPANPGAAAQPERPDAPVEDVQAGAVDPPPVPPIPPSLCDLATKYPDLKTVFWYSDSGDLYTNLISDTPFDVYDEVLLQAQFPPGGGPSAKACEYSSATILTCELLTSEELSKYQGKDMFMVLWHRFPEAGIGGDCILFESETTRLVPEAPQPDQDQAQQQDEEEKEDKERDEEEAHCSPGYEQVPGKPAGFCCPTGTTYNKATNRCDY